MGGLAHYLENRGLATTQISLIREHTVTIRPPRALWVPFDMGRPLGPPNDPAFQTRVLMACLELLEHDAGPVLRDWEEEAPEASAAETEGLACPIDLGGPAAPNDSATGPAERLLAEFGRLRPWYDLGVRQRGRTTVGASGMDPEAVIRFVSGFLEDVPAAAAAAGPAAADTLRLAVEDLKALYTEAAAAQPGCGSAAALEEWFWGRTAAGECLLALKPLLEKAPDEALRYFGTYMVPRSQAHRFDEPW